MTRYLSVCSGMECASLAFTPFGWQPLAFAEINESARAVIAHHHPGVPLHGDFTTLRAEPWIVDADLLCGGTPCQGFSVAGLRGGLSDPRGALTLAFMELSDAIDDLRRAAGRPAGVVFWENVPGTLSLEGNVFGNILSALVGEDTALRPPGGRWTDAGLVIGPRRTAAWRILDAQYFGLAQRRERLFVVASARDGFDPSEILFEPEGVRRYSPPGREAGTAVAALTANGVGTCGADDNQGQAGHLIPELATALRARDGAKGVDSDATDTLIPMAFGGNDTCGPIEVATALNAHGGPMGRIDFESETFVAQPLAFSCKDHGADATEGLAPTLRAMGHDGSHANGGGQLAIVVPLRVYGAENSNGAGVGRDGDPSLTLDCGGSAGVAIAFALRGREGGAMPEIDGAGDKVSALRAASGGSSRDYVAFAENSRAELRLEGGDGGVAGSLKVGGGKAGQSYPAITDGAAVRRLTPVECCRLQGVPDNYFSSVQMRGKPLADGPLYKMLGNGWAVPVISWIGRRIDAQLRRLDDA